MYFLKSIFSLTFLFHLSLPVSWSMSAKQQVAKNGSIIQERKLIDRFITSRVINSIPSITPVKEEFENSPFVKSNWAVWDRPEDQLAVEEGGSPMSQFAKNVKNNRVNRRKNKQYNNGTLGERYQVQKSTGSTNLQFPMTASSYSRDNTGGTQRQGCNNGNLQVSVFPVVLVFIAAIAGLITVFIVWFIARKWTDYGTTSTGHQYTVSSGWNGQGRDIGDRFSRVLNNLDFDQLTNLVMNGIETYRKYAKQS